MPLHDGETAYMQVWYARDGLERSAKLHGALEGEERISMGKAEAIASRRQRFSRKMINDMLHKRIYQG